MANTTNETPKGRCWSCTKVVTLKWIGGTADDGDWYCEECRVVVDL